MNKQDVNLIGFYYQEPLQVDGDISNSVMFKYDDERERVISFLKECSLNDFIYVMIRLFKDKYPDAGLLAAYISERDKSIRQGQKKIESGSSILRDDITQFYWHYHLDELKNVSYYLEQVTFSFKDEINLEDLINTTIESIEGKEFELTENTILVKDSAIDRFILSSTQIEIWVNPEKVVRY